jgi:hypothetical protein
VEVIDTLVELRPDIGGGNAADVYLGRAGHFRG